MSEFLEGFVVGGYRSIREPQFVGPLKKVTVLAGRNNTGKSNLLRFVERELGKALATATVPRIWSSNSAPPARANPAWTNADLPKNVESQSAIGIGNLRSEESYASIAGQCRMSEDRLRDIASEIDRRLVKSQGVSWWLWQPDDKVWRTALRKNLDQVLTQPEMSYKNKIEGLFLPTDLSIPTEIRYVSAFRELRPVPTDGEPEHSTGLGLIRLLGEVRDPGLEDKERMSARWNSFVEFFKQVVEDDQANIRIPRLADDLLIFLNDRELDVRDLGTGLHEVVIIAATATALDNALILLEEPEIHMHPLLQRKLMDYLSTHTTNQYLITTHSAHVLDTKHAAIFTVALEDGWTTVSPAVTNDEVVKTIGDLGYSPSDLLQTKAIVWVEGPSDRIYIEYWLSLVNPTLRPGVDYSVMFFGGSLLSHVTGEDSDFHEGENKLVELRRLNRRSFVVVDSDRGNSKASLKAYVQPLYDELGEDGPLWITDGREIENYVHPDLYAQAIAEVHTGIVKSGVEVSTNRSDKWGVRWQYRTSDDPEGSAWRKAKKVAVAEHIVQMGLELNRFHNELPDQVRKLASYLAGDHGVTKPAEPSGVE